MAVQIAVQMALQVAEQICKALISSAVLGRGSRNQFVINTKNLDPVNKIKVTLPLFFDKMEHMKKTIWLMFEREMHTRYLSILVHHHIILAYKSTLTSAYICNKWANIGNSFAFSLVKSTLARKKYTNAGSGSSN